jgi:hypothetical protein
MAVDIIICPGARTDWTGQRLQRQDSRGVLGSLLEEARYFYILQNVKTGCLSHPYSYLTGIWGPSVRVKRLTHKAQNASHTLQNLKMVGSVPPFSYIISFCAQRKLCLLLSLYTQIFMTLKTADGNDYNNYSTKIPS